MKNLALAACLIGLAVVAYRELTEPEPEKKRMGAPKQIAKKKTLKPLTP